MEETSLRIYEPNDLHALVALDRECFPPEFHFSVRAMRGFAEAPGACTLLAENTVGELAGFVIAHIEEGGSGQRCGYCLTLDVRAAERGRGLGARLLRAAEQQMAAVGATSMYLHVWTGNAGAIRLYQRLGYKLVGEVPGFYRAGLDALLYRKELAPLAS